MHLEAAKMVGYGLFIMDGVITVILLLWVLFALKKKGEIR
jgi:hypothetical protein